MNVEEIEQIIKMLKRYDLNKISVETEDIKVEIQDYKNTSSNLKNEECNYKESKQNEPQINNEVEEYIIKSPLVGSINLLENETTGKKYAVGDTIQKGQAICTIEAMKMFNEITTNKQGIINEILVSDNEFVEYDQPLVKLREIR